MPSMSGILTSEITTSHFCFFRWARACRPSFAVSTLWPWSSKITLRTSRYPFSSSAIRRFAIRKQLELTRKLDYDLGSFPFVFANIDPTAMVVYDLINDRQSKTCSSGRDGKRLIKMLEILRRETGPVVAKQH